MLVAANCVIVVLLLTWTQRLSLHTAMSAVRKKFILGTVVKVRIQFYRWG